MARGAASDLHVEKQILNKLNNLTKNKLSYKPAVGCNSMIFLPSLSYTTVFLLALDHRPSLEGSTSDQDDEEGQRPRPVYQKTDLEKVSTLSRRLRIMELQTFC